MPYVSRNSFLARSSAERLSSIDALVAGLLPSTLCSIVLGVTLVEAGSGVVAGFGGATAAVSCLPKPLALFDDFRFFLANIVVYRVLVVKVIGWNACATRPIDENSPDISQNARPAIQRKVCEKCLLASLPFCF